MNLFREEVFAAHAAQAMGSVRRHRPLALGGVAGVALIQARRQSRQTERHLRHLWHLGPSPARPGSVAPGRADRPRGAIAKPGAAPPAAPAFCAGSLSGFRHRSVLEERRSQIRPRHAPFGLDARPLSPAMGQKDGRKRAADVCRTQGWRLWCGRNRLRQLSADIRNRLNLDDHEIHGWPRQAEAADIYGSHGHFSHVAALVVVGWRDWLQEALACAITDGFCSGSNRWRFHGGKAAIGRAAGHKCNALEV